MKFFAILKDSLRETLDVWLLYVMIGLSLITVLLVASISYEPVTAERYLTFETGALNNLIRFQMQARPETRNLKFQIDIEDFQRTNEGTEPWLGDYKFDYVVKFSLAESPNATPLDKARDEKALEEIRDELKRGLRPDQLKRQFRDLFKEVEITEVQTEDPNEVRFHIVSTGTVIKSRQEWMHEPSLFFGLVKIPIPLLSLERMVRFIGDDILGKWGSAFTLLVSVIVTASFLPNMLAKGTVDLLLVRPISRVTLLLFKFCGGLLFMFLNTVVILAGIWLATGLRTGVWINSLLTCIFIFTFQFGMVYSVSALVAVYTRSAIVAILASLAFWTFLIGFGWAHWGYVENRRDNIAANVKEDPVCIALDVTHTILPRYKDIDWLTSKMIEKEAIKPRPEPEPDAANKTEHDQWEQRKKNAEEIHEKQLKDLDKRFGAYDWTSSLTVTSLFMLVMLALACWRFATRDY